MFQTLNLFEGAYVTDQEIEGLKRKVLNIAPSENIKEISTRKANQLAMLNTSIEKEMTAIGRNCFGLFNSVTHYTTHKKKQKHETIGNVMGGKAKLNDIAYNYCKTIALS